MDELIEFCSSITPDSKVHRYYSYSHNIGLNLKEVTPTEFHMLRYVALATPVVLCMFEDDTPIFGKITDIIVTKSGNCLFALMPYSVVCFANHYNSYEVTQTGHHYWIYRQEDFSDFHTLQLSKSFSHSHSHSTYVCMKYDVLSE